MAEPISENLQEMLDDRSDYVKELDMEAAKTIDYHIQKLRKQERKDKIHSTINKDLDLRDNFLGIRQLKAPYQPIPYIF